MPFRIRTASDYEYFEHVECGVCGDTVLSDQTVPTGHNEACSGCGTNHVFSQKGVVVNLVRPPQD